MSTEQSTEHGAQGRGPALPQSMAPPVEKEKPQIISSASFFISEKIQENSTEIEDSRDRDVDVDSVIAAIKLEMRAAMITPGSNFSDPQQIVDGYGELYSMQHLAPDDKLRVAQAYMEGVEQAKAEGRYFGRHPAAIEEEFAHDMEAAVNAFIKFAEKFGYSPKDKRQLKPDGTAKPEYLRELFDHLCFYYKPGEHLVHNSEEGNVSLKESGF